MSKFLHCNNNKDAKAIAIHQVFSENSLAQNEFQIRVIKVLPHNRDFHKSFGNLLFLLYSQDFLPYQKWNI